MQDIGARSRRNLLAVIVLRIGGVGNNRPVILARTPGWFVKKGHLFPGVLGYTPTIGQYSRTKLERMDHYYSIHRSVVRFG
jgi:hypothetical protein